ncbi:MAG: hypothetical protein JNM48_13990 [Rhodospirillales bacterium]|nr:hypothetical protein [Rhodospirillales bacterium]
MAKMCEKILDRIPTLTAEERLQLRQNCQRAVARAADRLLVLEAQRILSALDARERRESRVLARLPVARRIEFAFRRLPADDGERQVLRMLLSQEANASGGAVHVAVSAADSGVWHRRIGEICRQRRHLLRAIGQSEEWVAEGAGGDAVAWAAPLLTVDSDSGSVRLRPEAIAAFASLGYAASGTGEAITADGRMRQWAAAAE